MNKPKTTRSRKRSLSLADLDEAVEGLAEANPEPAPEPVPEPAPQPVPEPIREAPRLKVDTDDLMALAAMDSAELAALMEGNLITATADLGERVKGRVSRIGETDIFVEIGGKAEATIDRAELPHAKVGDTIEAMVLHNDDMGVRLSLKLSGQAALDYLEEAVANSTPIEGLVRSRNRGGYEVHIGSVRAFCPQSRISRLQDVDPDSYVGQVLTFRVIESGEKIVVDRRVLQEEEAEVKAVELWATLEVGMQLRGIVRNIQPFGVFVDIGGVDGLVPSRELGAEVARGVGLDVTVLEVDRATKRLTLSAKDPANDPWNRVGSEFVPGGVYRGEVVRVAPFGAFVELGGGLQGLVHSSRFGGGAPKVGSTLQVKLVEVDRDRQRLSLSPVTGDGVVPEPGQKVTGVVTEVLRNGAVVQLDDGRSGWLPEREAELPPNTVMAQRYRKGKPIEARISEDSDRRVTLSMRDDPAESEGAWRAHAAAQKGEGFGTMASLLGGLKLPK